MKRRLVLCLIALMVCLAPFLGAMATGVDYTIADKLLRQIEAGSGFRGTLTMELNAPEGSGDKATITTKPVSLDVSYIAVKPNEIGNTPGEKRLTLSTTETEDAKAQTLAQLSISGGQVLLSGLMPDEGWLSLGDSEKSAISAAADTALSDTPMPALIGYLAPMLLLNEGDSWELEDTLDAYLTKVDLWLEGYRESTEMGKLSDGTTTVEVSYQIPAPAIKAQLKQLIMDALADVGLTTILASHMSKDDASLLLNPRLQDFYFDAVDDLPISGMMVVDRAYTLTGETLRLSISLPMYDKTAGAVTAKYERAKGENDQPDMEKLTLEGEKQRLALSYTAYQTLTGVTVYQGSILRQGIGEDEARKLLALSFSLTHQSVTSVGEEGKDELKHDFELSIAPDTSVTASGEREEITPLDIKASLLFSGRSANNVATELTMNATVSSDTLPQTMTISLTGKTVTPWTPEKISGQSIATLSAMTSEQRDAMLLHAGVKLMTVLTPSLSIGSDLADWAQGFIGAPQAAQ